MRRLFAGALLIATVACGARSEQEADRAIQAAQDALRRGALDEALGEADRGLNIAERQPDSARAHRVRLLRAEILLAKPDLAGALPLVNAPIPDRSDFAPLRARQAYLVARAQVVQSRLADALATLDRVRGLAPAARDVQLDADILRGQVLSRLGRWSEAETALKAVVSEAETSGDRYREVLALNNLGMGFVVRSRFDQALTWFEQVLSFRDLEQTSVYAIALNNAGACYARLGQFDRATATQSRAVEMHERRGAAGPYEQALGELGSTFLLQDDVPRAVPYLQKALAIAGSANLDADAALWAKNLAAAYVYSGQWDEAERFNEEARRRTPPDRRGKLVFSVLHAARIAAGRKQAAEATRLFEQALAESETEPSVRWGAHEGLASLAVAAGDRAAAARHYQAALDTIERTRSDLLRTDYKLSFLDELIGFYRAYVDTLVDQGDVERALAVADSSRGRLLAERHGVEAPARASASHFRQLAAHSNAVLASYWLGASRSYLWTVDRDQVRLFMLPPAAQIDALVRRHQDAIQNAMADPLKASGQAGDRLYELLVAPFARSLPRDATVVIVPDGTLYGLNFETLPVEGPVRHYWIEDVSVQIAPSLSLLTARRPPASPHDRTMLLIGNPVAHPGFPPLRYASREIAQIAARFGDRLRAYQSEEATPVAYRTAGPDQFSLVHFTAHATTNVQSPLDSAVILSGPESGFKLYARDVADLPLDAELVTISACRSAGERTYSGEGLIGFAWAFLRAGARRVIAGLWDVDDRSTAELMDALYGRMAAGASPAQALRDAKLALLRSRSTFSSPYYWAPFELFTVVP